ncbi:MAG: MgtC/SapB family protein [Verrucomicrobiales bacterium]
MEILFENYESQLINAVIVAFAAVLTGLIGLEREYSGKPAGFRTHMLVGGAAALLVLVAEVIVQRSVEVQGAQSYIQADPIRVLEAIIVGVSFIGAGTVLKVEEGSRVKYLTTAASILFAAGVGIAVALYQFILAILLVVTVLVINVVLAKIGARIGMKAKGGKE